MNKFFDNEEFGKWFFALRRAKGYSHIRDFCKDVEQRTGVWLNSETMKNIELGKSKISLEAFLASMPVLISEDEDSALLTIVTELGNFLDWEVMPDPGKCPVCGEQMLIEKTDKGMWHLHCSNADCLIAEGREYRTREEAMAYSQNKPEKDDAHKTKEPTPKKVVSSIDVGSLPKFMSVSEMADYAKISNPRIYKFIKTGKIPARKRGGKIKASREDFVSFLVADGRVA